jgi:hypothetical protein
MTKVPDGRRVCPPETKRLSSRPEVPAVGRETREEACLARAVITVGGAPVGLKMTGRRHQAVPDRLITELTAHRTLASAMRWRAMAVAFVRCCTISWATFYRFATSNGCLEFRPLTDSSRPSRIE